MYFSQAKDEKIDDEDVTDINDADTKGKLERKKIIPAAGRLRNKSIARRNKTKVRFPSESKGKPRKKKVHSRILDGKPGEREIIHTTENQTNLECEVVNNKHFEADLKAIFIEIMSENTNKMGMFSVLSRMFSGNGDTISNFSLGSMTAEKNEFSISPVSKTILHCERHNEFLNWNFPPCRLNGSGRECVSASSRDPLPSDVSAREAAGDESIFRSVECASRVRFESAPDERGAETTFEHSFRFSVNRRRVARHRAEASAEESAKEQVSEATTEHDHSPQAILRRIVRSPAFVRPGGNGHVRRCSGENQSRIEGSRSKHRRQLAICDDDSDDDNEVSHGSLKIFCTPSRPKRGSAQDCSELETVPEDDEDDFNIFDRT